MPAKNSLKTYVSGGIYHVYNRGVEKRSIFLDEQDYRVFLSYLKIYLSPRNDEDLKKIATSPTISYKEKAKASNLLSLKNYSVSIDLLCYVLMPNHFHLLIKQSGEEGINHFMRSLITKYSMYFNRKYHRVGPLFQGVYKAVLVTKEEQLLHLTRYIHNNPQAGLMFPSSLPEYLGKRITKWVKPDLVLNYFNRANPVNSYAGFMEETPELEIITDLILDLD